MRKNVIVAILLTLSMATSFAGGMTELKPVTSVHYYKGHFGLLLNQSGMINPDGCQRNEWYILPSDHPNYTEMVALIMASHFKRHPLAFYVDGCVQGLPAVVNVVSNKL